MKAFAGQLEKGDRITLANGAPAEVRKVKADGPHYRLTVTVNGVETTALVTACTQYERTER